MSDRRVDRASLISGIAVAALGVVLLMDQTDAIELTLGWSAAAIAATLGIVLLASGLRQGEG